MILMVALAACSPAYNWRQVRHELPTGQMLMPCKPEEAQRRVPLLGQDRPPVELWMLSCDVKGQTFAWSAVHLPPESDFLSVEMAWRKAAWVALAIPLPEADQVPEGWQQVDSRSPSLHHSQWQGPGNNHRGEPLQAHLRWFQSGEWIHLAALYGKEVDAETLYTFFDSFSNRGP